MELVEMELFKDRKDEILVDFEVSLEKCIYVVGEVIYLCGVVGDVIYLIWCGLVKIIVLFGVGCICYIVIFGCGDFFGGQVFFDGWLCGNDVIVVIEMEFFVLLLEQFNKLVDEYKKLVFILLVVIFCLLVMCLCYVDIEIVMFQEY